ncbi:hypothetical protein BH11CYA1_BH11CYA1_43340 [soil metagenome]
MGPFYTTKPGASTTCAARRIGDFGAVNFATANMLKGKNHDLCRADGGHPGREPDTLSN